MLKQLQLFQRKSTVFKEIFDAESIKFDSRDAALADFALQFSVDTATWALTIYEHDLGIPTEISKPPDERRSVIKSKMRGSGKVDAALIESVAESYSNGDVQVLFDGKITIRFVSALGLPPNIDDLKAAIEEIKPAHLPIFYSYRYLTITEIEGMTITQIEATTLDRFAGGGA